jgi:hypothetical protein
MEEAVSFGGMTLKRILGPWSLLSPLLPSHQDVSSFATTYSKLWYFAFTQAEKQ